MIRYAISDADLRNAIDIEVRKKRKNDTWESLVARAAKNSKAAKVDNLWSLVKPVYLKLQHGKCGYCERMLGADEKLPYEKDVEHFRPKKRLDPWPPGEFTGREPWPTDLPSSAHQGRGWLGLAHHPWNYLISCKECNQRWKRNFFPTAARPNFQNADPRQLRPSERPFLIYPLHDSSNAASSIDDDPETLIAWEGIYALPAQNDKKRPEHWRAKLTIAFFGLNDRANVDRLLIARAHRLKTIGLLLEKYNQQPSETAANKFWDDEVVTELSPSMPHTACVNAVLRLYFQRPEAALKVIEDAEMLLKKELIPIKNPPPPPPNRRASRLLKNGEAFEYRVD